MRVPVSIGVALGLAAIVSSCSALGTLPGVEAAARRPLSTTEKEIIARAVAQKMYDLDAAKFEWAPFIIFHDQGAYCGLVNGKNLHGGYIGFQPFLAQIHENASNEIVSAEMLALSSGPDEYGLDSVASSCAHFGY